MQGITSRYWTILYMLCFGLSSTDPGKNLEFNLRESEDWLQELAFTSHLSFFSKKKKKNVAYLYTPFNICLCCLALFYWISDKRLLIVSDGPSNEAKLIYENDLLHTTRGRRFNVQILVKRLLRSTSTA